MSNHNIILHPVVNGEEDKTVNLYPVTSKVISGNAVAGAVLTADGEGGSVWSEPSTGSVDNSPDGTIASNVPVIMVTWTQATGEPVSTTTTTTPAMPQISTESRIAFSQDCLPNALLEKYSKCIIINTVGAYSFSQTFPITYIFQSDTKVGLLTSSMSTISNYCYYKIENNRPYLYVGSTMGSMYIASSVSMIFTN